MSNSPSRIGVTCDYERYTDRRGAPAARYLCPEGYVRALQQAGAEVVLLPHQANASAILADLRGLVVAGGDFDVPPAYYGQRPRPKLGHHLEERSAFERDLLQAALDYDLPILGVCGGMQLLNVVAGGTLHQDLGERPGTQVHEQPHDKRQPHHAVTTAPGSLLRRAYGSAVLQVNSTHHQVIDRLGHGVKATGIAPDGVVEAIELPEKGFAVGVQWHPEALLDPQQWGIYRALVAAAQAAA